jgi:ATP-dependent Clp protease protease subunit
MQKKQITMKKMTTETSIELPKPLKRKLYLAAQVDQESMNDLTKSILEINDSDEELKKIYAIYDIEYKPKPIEIIIDSYGGLVYQCMGLLGVMNQSKTPVHTIVTGAAMSCGFMILIHGHKRFAYEHATPMYHQVSTGFWGKVQDLEEEYKETKRLQKKFEKLTLERTKITKDRLKEILKTKHDWFMDAKEALKQGVVDEIIE